MQPTLVIHVEIRMHLVVSYILKLVSARNRDTCPCISPVGENLIGFDFATSLSLVFRPRLDQAASFVLMFYRLRRLQLTISYCHCTAPVCGVCGGGHLL